VLRFAGAFTNLSKLCNNAGSKLVCGAKPACFDFSSSILTCSVTYWAQEVALITTTSSQAVNGKDSWPPSDVFPFRFIIK
jgi:hypothetical protein